MLIKVGEDYYKGKALVIYMLSGKAIKDGEITETKTGKKIGKVSVKTGENRDGSASFITVSAWEEKSGVFGGIRKGDGIFAIGTISEREFNGKTYRDLNAEYIGVNTAFGGAGITASATAAEPTFTPVQQGFVDITTDDEELPF